MIAGGVIAPVYSFMKKEDLFEWAVKGFLGLSPLFFFQNYQLSFARGLFFIIGTFLLFAVSLNIEPKRKFQNSWICLFLGLSAIRMFFDNGAANQKQEWFNFWISSAQFMYVFCGVLLFYVVYCYIDRVRPYLYVILWVCIANAVLTIAQIFNYDFMWHARPSLCGFMETSSQLGQYSALSIPLVYLLNPFFALIPLFTLVASRSISPILACAIGMGVLFLEKGSSGKIIGICAAVLVLLVSFNVGYIKAKWQCRPVMWQKTMRVALQKPYLGWGYGSFREKVLDNKSAGSLGRVEFSHPHNDYLHTAQEAGFPVLLCIALFFRGLFRKFGAIEHKSVLILCLFSSTLISLVNMSGQTVIRYASITGTFIIVLALLSVQITEEGNAGIVQ